MNDKDISHEESEESSLDGDMAGTYVLILKFLNSTMCFIHVWYNKSFADNIESHTDTSSENSEINIVRNENMVKQDSNSHTKTEDIDIKDEFVVYENEHKHNLYDDLEGKCTTKV